MWVRMLPEKLDHKELFVPEDKLGEMAIDSWTVAVWMSTWNL